MSLERMTLKMKFKLSSHAEKELERRRIPLEVLESVLNNPVEDSSAPASAACNRSNQGTFPYSKGGIVE